MSRAARRVAAASAALALLGGAQMQAAAAERRSAPSAAAMRLAGRILLVDAHVNGQGPLPFILDTGATESVLTPAAARRLGLTDDPPGFWSMETARSVAVGAAEVRDLAFWVTDPPQALPLRIDKGIDYHGILGYTFLSRFVTTLDYRAGTAVFASPFAARGKTAEGRTALRVPIDIRGRLVYARGRINGHGPLSMLVDTGAAEVLLWPWTAAAIGLTAAGPTDRPGVGYAHATVAMGDAVANRVPCIIGRLEQDPPAGCDAIVGTPFLSRFVVTVDYRRRELTLAPNAGPDAESR